MPFRWTRPSGHPDIQRPFDYCGTPASSPTDGGPDPREVRHYSWFLHNGQPANYYAQAVSLSEESSERRQGDLLSIWTPIEKLFILSLVHRVYANVEMGLLPESIDVSRLAHAAVGAHVSTVTAGEDGTFVDDHKRHAISREWGSMCIERREIEAEAASMAGTACAGN